MFLLDLLHRRGRGCDRFTEELVTTRLRVDLLAQLADLLLVVHDQLQASKDFALIPNVERLRYGAADSEDKVEHETLGLNDLVDRPRGRKQRLDEVKTQVRALDLLRSFTHRVQSLLEVDKLL